MMFMFKINRNLSDKNKLKARKFIENYMFSTNFIVLEFYQRRSVTHNTYTFAKNLNICILDDELLQYTTIDSSSDVK
jgi:hypothetical protein